MLVNLRLFNRLSEADSYEENQLFATLDPMTRKLIITKWIYSVNNGYSWLYSRLPTTLIAAFRSTLEEVKEADLLLHVVDMSNPDYFHHEKTVKKLLDDLEIKDIPQITVYNKKDIQHPDFVPTADTYMLLI